MKWAVVAQIVAAPLPRNVADAEDLSHTNPHTVLHLLTNPSDDQAAILQMLAPEFGLALATNIWTAWSVAFTTLCGPQLPLEFRTAALDTLKAIIVTSAAISAQALALAQWALHSIPIEILQIATYRDLCNEKDMTAWYDPATYSPQSKPHHANTLDASILLALQLILSNFFLRLYTLTHISMRKATTPNRPDTAQIALKGILHSLN